MSNFFSYIFIISHLIQVAHGLSTGLRNRYIYSMNDYLTNTLMSKYYLSKKRNTILIFGLVFVTFYSGVNILMVDLEV